MSSKTCSPSFKALFPQLSTTVHGYPFLYMDTAATALKPLPVIEATTHLYRQDYATVHRSVYSFAESATHQYEQVREKARDLIGATSTNEIVFTRGTTESINLLAQLMEQRIKKGDVILISEIEHNSNMIPWQFLCKRIGSTLKTIRVDERGELDLAHLEELLKIGDVHLVSIAHASNVTGAIHPVKEVSKLTQKYGALLSLDGAQAVPHLPVDVNQMGADFYHFSSHKLYGPTGIGVFYGREALLEAFQPVQGGGDMVLDCTFESSTPEALPIRFEAGTPNIAGVIGFGAAIDFLREHNRSQQQENELLRKSLQSIEGVRLIGEPKEHIGICTFVCEQGHAMDIALLLDAKGIALRSGHLCSHPTLKKYGVSCFIRASLGLYNDVEDIHRFEKALRSALQMF